MSEYPTKIQLLNAIKTKEFVPPKGSRSDRHWLTSHGMSQTPTYQTWNGIRCRVKYNYYGAKHIDMDDRWHQFENFLADMGERPSKNHQLRRLDLNKGFYKENCQWFLVQRSTKTNQRTKKKKRTPAVTAPLTYAGHTRTIKEWAELFDIPAFTLYQRIYKLKWPIEEALCEPVQSRKHRKPRKVNSDETIETLPMARAAVEDRRKRVIDQRNTQ